jgi:NADP-dependent 3-hydroxy acid dehydrogenase YdfG
MIVSGKVVVVTGGAHGIGAALARRFAAEGAGAVVVADIDGKEVQKLAAEIGGFSMTADVSQEADVRRLVEETRQRFGPIDLFCSNAGIFTDGGVETPDAAWKQILDINVMAHIYAGRAVLPGMLARGEGYLLQTVSAAGLLTSIGSAPYAVTKHAALALAEMDRHHARRRGHQGLGQMPSRCAHKHAQTRPGEHPGRRLGVAGRGGGGSHSRDRRRTLLDPSSPTGCRIFSSQGAGLRSLAARHATATAPGA